MPENSLLGDWSFAKYQESVKAHSQMNLKEKDFTLDGELSERLDFSKVPANLTPEDKLIWRILCTASPTPV